MAKLVCSGAGLQCSFGAAPSTLNVLPVALVTPAATIADNKPGVNVPPFGMCSSAANPSVASATAAALGVLTPMPCTPVTAAPWAPGSPTVQIGGVAALNQSSKLACNWGGVIQITSPGPTVVDVP